MSHYTYTELLTAGRSANDIRADVRAGRLRRVRQGVYAEGVLSPRDEHVALVTSTAPFLQPDSVISHESAALMLNLPLWRLPVPRRVAVTRPGAGNGHIRQAVHTRRCSIEPDEITTAGGVPVTTPARTAVDLARLHGPDVGIAALDAALALGAEVAELGELVARGRRRPGNQCPSWLVPLARAAAESPAESVSRLRMHQCGLPEPVLQLTVRTPEGLVVGRGDFAWPDARLIGECDGAEKYDNQAASGRRAADMVLALERRDRGFRDAEWDVVHWGVTELLSRTVFGSMLRAALTRAARRA